MKTSIYILMILIGATTLSCNRNSNQVPGDVVNIPNSADGKSHGDGLPVMQFEETTHDFGRIIQGEIVSYAFKFKNTGTNDLVISNISASCGCTIPEYPKKPVKPGQEEYVKVTFQSTGKRGFQHKTITIAANTQPSTILLNIKAEVIIPERN